MKKGIFLVLTVCALFALDCNNPANMLEANQCAKIRLEDADIELNVVYKKLMRYLDKDAKAKLREAQRAWIKYRDKSAEFAASLAGGRVAALYYTNEKARITQQRVRELKALLKELQSM